MKKLLSSKNETKSRRKEKVTLESSKTLGGIGAILMFIGILPYVSFYGIIPLVGLILVMVAMYSLANHYMESGIFNNALYGVITAIVGGIIFAAVAVFALFGFFTELGLNLGAGNIADWTAILSGADWTMLTADFMGIFVDFALYIILDLVVLFVFVVLTAVFLRKSLRSLSAKSGVGLFGTAGLIILIGAVLTIILIWAILIWIALLLLAIAFFQIKPQQTQPPPPY
jgi:uncharacterized membrane protein